MIELSHIGKKYRMGDGEVDALADVNLFVSRGEFVAVIGPSGSGKSTLMNIMGCLDRPSAGAYRLDGVNVELLGADELAAVRGRKIGFVFQGFQLLPRLTALENVELPLMIAGVGAKERRRRAGDALVRVGLDARMRHRPSQLSGGQQQRVAIARALVTDPPVLLADEPTGNLDSRASRDVMDLLCALNAQGRTVVLITHDPGVAARAGRQVRVKDGRLEGAN
ncbi:ATP-binding cassette domain-containing protein [Beduinella massiliensis]|uniref:ATP-binding cassette domain-containing protein n=1 Tax=Beduinella massiliensis TaxID=1852363 RepID=UPI000C85F0F8